MSCPYRKNLCQRKDVNLYIEKERCKGDDFGDCIIYKDITFRLNLFLKIKLPDCLEKELDLK